MAEILAPAGGQEQLLAAVRCGADAVYLGTQGFNARRNAENFDDAGFHRAVRFCHGRGVKVYVTVNTLVPDEEFPALEREAALIAEAGADAVILQDMAALRLFSHRYPGIGRIASTQTAVHNTDGAKFLRDAGFDTIVLARELSLSEMEKILSSVDIKVEAFVHGAHCMSLSGACYLSSMLGGRSGNRGLCAQPCRLAWHCGGDRDGWALSLKDMSLIGHIRDMAGSGITSFKIEGRMKRPEYVAAAVSACRAALLGEAWDEDALRAVFSRSGFTDGYLTGRRDGTMFGRRTHEDVTSAAGVLKDLAALYEKETPRVPVRMFFETRPDETRLTVSDGQRELSVSGPVPEPAQGRALTPDAAEKNLCRTGGTPFTVQRFEGDIMPGLYLRAADLNALRRKALDELLVLRETTPPHIAEPFVIAKPEPRARSTTPALWARFSRSEQVSRAEVFERILLPMEQIGTKELEAHDAKLVAQLPAALWPEDEDAFFARLASLRDAGLRQIYADNLYGLELGRRLGLSVLGGFSLNVTNTEALRFYEARGLAGLCASFELSMAKLKTLGGGMPLGAVAYGRLPLMRFRNCPLRAGPGCASCGGHGELTDRLGVKFPAECSEKRFSTLLNSVPLHIAERDMTGLDFALLYFTVESPAECGAVTEDFLLRRKSENPRTGGLYYRELL